MFERMTWVESETEALAKVAFPMLRRAMRFSQEHDVPAILNCRGPTQTAPVNVHSNSGNGPIPHPYGSIHPNKVEIAGSPPRGPMHQFFIPMDEICSSAFP